MFDSNRRIGSSSSSHLYVVAVFALLLSLTHGQTQVATLVAAPDLQLENATIDMPRWHFYSEAACCWRPGCAYYDWFGGTGWNRRSFKEDYAPFENSQGQFIFEVNNDRTRMETYCRAELKYTMMDVAVNADDVIYRSTVKLDFTGSSRNATASCKVQYFEDPDFGPYGYMTCGEETIQVEWSESGTTNIQVIVSRSE